MLDSIPSENILFLDIETVPAFPAFSYLPEAWKKLWEKKSALKRKEKTAEEYYPSAGIFAEFGKIICICCGYLTTSRGKRQFRTKSFAGDDEKQILSGFADLLNSHFSKKDHTLCAHNGKEFDFPFIARRMLINGIRLPLILDLAGKKPWEVQLLDTMELWKFGDYKSFTSLELLASVFGIKTPKDDIDGSMIWKVYWQNKDLKRIVTYCRKDVITIAQVFLRFRGEEKMEEKEISIAD